MARIKPIEGQQSLFGDPPIRRCRRCGKALRGEKARAAGYGPTCGRIASGRLEVRVYCRDCGRRLQVFDDGTFYPACDTCGAGYSGPLCVRRKLFKVTQKRKAKR